MAEPSFRELGLALSQAEGRSIKANYGLDPQLGKYHRTVCADCFTHSRPGEVACIKCGSLKRVKGVADRIAELKTAVEASDNRPPYIHQVPLEFIPGLGPRMLGKLLDHFGTEMAVLHSVPLESLKEVIPEKMAVTIDKARNGELAFHAGGANGA